MTEIEILKEIIREICEHAWGIECRCCLPCQTDDCYYKESEEMIDCMCEKFINNVTKKLLIKEKENETIEVVINSCYGGFGLSEEALKYMGIPYKVNKYGLLEYEEPKRTDERLIKCVKELGKKACAEYSELRVIKIPNNIEWSIESYDGDEWVSEKHRVWYK